MTVVNFILLVLALVCFLVAAVIGYGAAGDGTATWHRTNFVALGLAFWVVTFIIGAFPH